MKPRSVDLSTAAARWDHWRWLRRLENVIAAKGIADLNRKKAVLLHHAGEEVFDLSEDLGVVADTTYE